METAIDPKTQAIIKVNTIERKTRESRDKKSWLNEALLDFVECSIGFESISVKDKLHAMAWVTSIYAEVVDDDQDDTLNQARKDMLESMLRFIAARDRVEMERIQLLPMPD